jgi:RimJ/RimL family protein N-acetyltransferase
MLFEGNRIFLKRLSFDELEGNYVQWLNDKEVCKYNSHGGTLYTRDMAETFIRTLDNDQSREVYAVYLKDTSIHIGNISLQQIDFHNSKAELAYLFGEKAYWNNGYAQEAGEILLKRAFAVLGLHRVYFGTHVDNLGMRRLGEKLGFLMEGILKEAFFKNGKFYDITLYGKLRQQKR